MGADSSFSITREQPQTRPDVAIFHLTGWLDMHSENQLIEAVQAAKDEGLQFVLLDMRDVGTITSAGIRAIQKIYQIVTPKDAPHKYAHLKLCNAPAQVYQVLGITGFLENVPMYENMEDAVATFGK